jgi:hypothetical protein
MAAPPVAHGTGTPPNPGPAAPGRLRLAVAAAVMLAAHSAQAAPAGHDDPQVLSIENASGQTTAKYGLDQLRRDFPLRVMDTRTPWTAGGEVIRFRGPDLAEVLARNGLADEGSIEASAYDDFVTTIRMDEIAEYKPILALERACTDADRKTGRCKEGEEFRPLTMEDSGPYSIIWPYDQLPSSYVPGRNSIWVWFVVVLRPAP